MSSAWSAEILTIAFPVQEVRQGSLVKAKLFVPPELVNIPVQKLKGETSAETIYFHQISPLLKKEGSANYESDVQIIFTKVPESNHLILKINEQPIDLEWNNIQIIPVETPEGMIWADFSAPDFFEGKLTWLWIALLFLVLGIGGFFIWKKIDTRTKEKSRKQKLIDEFKSCQNYEDVVALWKRKRSFMKDFPHLDSTFPAFESVLFKYQFKPVQTENEKLEVMTAYRTLVEQSEGGFRGI
ncbi:MAG: hypothetical protein V4598_15485 [Bdellovibrionota bacterium]